MTASLRQGLVGAWCPSLGPVSYTLIDRTAYTRNAAPANIGTNDVRAAPGGMAAYMYDSYFDAGNAGALAFSSPFCFSSWGYGVTTAVDGAPISKNMRVGGYPGAMQWISGGKLVAYWANSARATSDRTVTGINAWQHWLVQWTGATAEVWVNGVLDASSATTVGANATQSSIRIGAYDSNRAIRGYLDDCRIYSRSLTPSEIKLLASQRGIGLIPTGRTLAKFPTTLYQNVGGVWTPTQPQINVGGTWKTASPAINVGGVWK